MFIKRMFENITVNLVSSLLIYVLIKADIIYMSEIGSFFAFLASGIIFFILNAAVLKKYLFYIMDTKVYLVVNLVLFAIQVSACYLCMYFANAEVYTALFGYTRVFRPFIKCKSAEACNIISAALFWVLFLAQIIFYAKKLSVMVSRFADDIDEYGMTEYNMDTIDFMTNQKK